LKPLSGDEAVQLTNLLSKLVAGHDADV
jgi:hypothetical protein